MSLVESPRDVLRHIIDYSQFEDGISLSRCCIRTRFIDKNRASIRTRKVRDPNFLLFLNQYLNLVELFCHIRIENATTPLSIPSTVKEARIYVEIQNGLKIKFREVHDLIAANTHVPNLYFTFNEKESRIRRDEVSSIINTSFSPFDIKDVSCYDTYIFKQIYNIGDICTCQPNKSIISYINRNEIMLILIAKSINATVFVPEDALFIAPDGLPIDTSIHFYEFSYGENYVCFLLGRDVEIPSDIPDNASIVRFIRRSHKT